MDPVRTFAHSCAHVIAAMQAECDASSIVCVVIATKREVLEIDASTVMIGPDPANPERHAAPDILVDFACRIRPAIEAVARQVAHERGEVCQRRLDLERELAACRVDSEDVS